MRWAAILLAGLPLLLAAFSVVSAILRFPELSRLSWRGFLYLVLIEAAVLVVFASVGVIYQARGNARDERLYPPPGKLIDMGGYRLHLYCNGTGGPTVVLNYGLGGSYLDWFFVQPEVARFTRVCSWDRSGYGWSERSPKAQVPSTIAGELHELLEKAGEKPPYILVGHSLGAFDVRMYAKHYPDELAGIVLVDGSHPDEDLTFSRREKLWLRFLQLTAPFGLPRWRKWCTQGEEEIRLRKTAFQCRSRVYRAHYEQWAVFPHSSDEVRELGSLDNLPLVVIARDPSVRGNRQEIREREESWQAKQRELSRLSRDSIFVVAEGSGHSVPKQRPDVIVEAIRTLVNRVRERKS